MPIADRPTVRIKAGNRSTATLADATIDTIIQQTDAFVMMFTRKYDWQPTDKDYHVIKRASELLASADIRKMFNDKDEEADEQRREAMKDLESIATHSDVAGVKTHVSSRPYMTWPANTSGGSIYFNDGITVNIASEGVEPL
jgi:hypothetical protein